MLGPVDIEGGSREKGGDNECELPCKHEHIFPRSEQLYPDRKRRTSGKRRWRPIRSQGGQKAPRATTPRRWFSTQFTAVNARFRGLPLSGTQAIDPRAGLSIASRKRHRSDAPGAAAAPGSQKKFQSIRALVGPPQMRAEGVVLSRFRTAKKPVSGADRSVC